MAVLREGAETVLFVGGLGVGSPAAHDSLLLGAVGGLVAGASLGVLIYLGLSVIKPRQLFAVTNR